MACYAKLQVAGDRHVLLPTVRKIALDDLFDVASAEVRCCALRSSGAPRLGSVGDIRRRCARGQQRDGVEQIGLSRQARFADADRIVFGISFDDRVRAKRTGHEFVSSTKSMFRNSPSRSPACPEPWPSRWPKWDCRRLQDDARAAMEFLYGVALDDDAWGRLVEDPSANTLLTPIFALALANMFDDNSTPAPTADLVAKLSTVVPLIPEFWNDDAQEPDPEPAPRVRSPYRASRSNPTARSNRRRAHATAPRNRRPRLTGMRACHARSGAKSRSMASVAKRRGPAFCRGRRTLTARGRTQCLQDAAIQVGEREREADGLQF
jgi:hypothetical protein